jgi:hypothetical protein
MSRCLGDKITFHSRLGKEFCSRLSVANVLIYQ